MLKVRDELMKIAARLLKVKESDDLHDAQQSTDITKFPINSFVLATQRTNPDYLEFITEEILDMTGNISQFGTLKFHIKWLNYPHEGNTWEPWKHLRKAEKLHRFLMRRNLQHLIPLEIRLDYVQ